MGIQWESHGNGNSHSHSHLYFTILMLFNAVFVFAVFRLHFRSLRNRVEASRLRIDATPVYTAVGVFSSANTKSSQPGDDTGRWKGGSKASRLASRSPTRYTASSTECLLTSVHCRVKHALAASAASFLVTSTCCCRIQYSAYVQSPSQQNKEI